jgi:MAternally-affected-uncoordination protein
LYVSQLIIIILLQQIHSNERDYLSACGLLGVGADYAHISGAHYSRLLFTLSKCMVCCETKNKMRNGKMKIIFFPILVAAY